MRGINYEKKSVMLIVIGVFIFLLAGCCTCRRTGTDDKDVIAGNSRATGKLEATVQALDGTVANSRERIANIIETSRGIADGVERVEYLFNEYEREVEQLLKEIDRIRNEAEFQGESDKMGYGNTGTVCDS